MAKIRKRKLVSNNGKTIRWVYLVDYTDSNNKRRAKQFTTRKEAETWMHQAMVDKKSGTHVPDSQSITVKKAGKIWLAAVEFDRERRPATLKQYRIHLNHHICDRRFGIGGIKLSQLTTSRIAQFHQDLVRKRSRSTAVKVLKSLKSLLKEAQVKGYVNQNVALPVGVHKAPNKERRAKVPPKEIIIKILNQAPEKLWRPLLYVAVFCGLRAGEIRALVWDNVDLEKGIIHVTQAADLYSNIGTPKSMAGFRDVPMSPTVITTLKVWKLRCAKSPLNLVFPNAAKNVLAQNAIYRNLWTKLMRGIKATEDGTTNGKPLFRFHDLRHTAASLYIASGANPKRVAVIMGHSSVKITFDLYGHLWEDIEGDRALAAGAENALFSE